MKPCGPCPVATPSSPVRMSRAPTPEPGSTASSTTQLVAVGVQHPADEPDAVGDRLARTHAVDGCRRRASTSSRSPGRARTRLRARARCGIGRNRRRSCSRASLDCVRVSACRAARSACSLAFSRRSRAIMAWLLPALGTPAPSDAPGRSPRRCLGTARRARHGRRRARREAGPGEVERDERARDHGEGDRGETLASRSACAWRVSGVRRRRRPCATGRSARSRCRCRARPSRAGDRPPAPGCRVRAAAGRRARAAARRRR